MIETIPFGGGTSTASPAYIGARVSIVGRPNVGKSTLFNALAGRRLAIVDAVAGTTRDRLNSVIILNETVIKLTDTGGLFDVNFNSPMLHQGSDDKQLKNAVEKQIKTAVQESDLILFVVDIRSGLTPDDRKIADFLRRQNKPVLLVVNKADTVRFDAGAPEFFALGLGEPLPVSALQKRELDSLTEQISKSISQLKIKPVLVETVKNKPIKLDIVGKRNVGKSTLVNMMAKEERVIVSEIPGTTRDAIDVEFKYKDKSFIAIDTAGLFKKTKLKEAVDFYSRFRTESAVRRAEVVLFLIDARDKISTVDKKIGRFISEQEKPCIIIVNKWDIVAEEMTVAGYRDYINQMLPELKFAPISFISAKTGFNVWKTISLSEELVRQSLTKISTVDLNKILQKIKTKLAPPGRTGRFPKVYYATQSSVGPPRLIIFVNDPLLFTVTYQRFLMNQLRSELPFAEVPFRIELRKKPGDSVRDYSSFPETCRGARRESRARRPAGALKSARPGRDKH